MPGIEEDEEEQVEPENKLELEVTLLHICEYHCEQRLLLSRYL